MSNFACPRCVESIERPEPSADYARGLEDAAKVCEAYRWPPQGTDDDLWLSGALDTCTQLAKLIRAKINAAEQELPAVTSASRAMKASESGYRSDEHLSNAGDELAGRRSTTDSLSRDSAQQSEDNR